MFLEFLILALIALFAWFIHRANELGLLIAGYAPTTFSNLPVFEINKFDFSQKSLVNQEGYSIIEQPMLTVPTYLSVNEFEEASEHAVILDTRHQDEFRVGHVPGAINIPLNEFFELWVEQLLSNKQTPFLLVTEAGMEESTYVALKKTGYVNVRGALKNGYSSWKKARSISHVQTINAVDLKEAMGNNQSVILDVRQRGEHQESHLKNAVFAPLDQFLERIHGLDPNKSYFVYCESGYRSMIACSFLLNRGYTNIIDIDGGYDALQYARFPKVKSN